MYFLNFKSFFSVKDNTKKMKGQTTDWEKMFANLASDKGLEYVTITHI